MAVPFHFKLFAFTLQIVWTVFAFIQLIITIITHPVASFQKKSRTVPPKILQDPSYGTHEFVTVNGVKFHYVTAGDKQKPFMLFLHGFPEFWFSWRYQLKELQKDYYVVAVDMRGYGETEKPAGVHNYTISLLKQDVVELIKELGGGRKCNLVAHDWGGVIAWRVVQRHPELIERFIVLNCPHPKAYQRALAKDWKQLGKSWYIFLFQTPWLPERMLSLRDYGLFNAMYRGKNMGFFNKERCSDEVLESFKYTFSREGALTPPINYYRNLLSGGDSPPRKPGDPKPSFTTPTLLIWGKNDGALDISLVDYHKDICENLVIETIPDCSHWVQQDSPDLVNQYIKEFMEAEN